MAEIVTLDNLYLAYWRAKRAKESRQEVIDFALNFDANIKDIAQKLSGAGPIQCEYRSFTIFDPKTRIICAAPFYHRVLQHAIINVCGPLIDKRLIDDTYACRKGKGQYKALEKARGLHARSAWRVKLDIRKYFDSIDHWMLKRLLYRTFKEERLLQILYEIIDSYDSGRPGRGIPIGNLTSQYFANYYLDALDKYIKCDLRIKGYVRYMDDMLIYGDDVDEIRRWVRSIISFVNEKLLLEFKIVDIKPTTKAVPFLGYRIYKTHMRLNERSRRRFREKIKIYNWYYNSGQWDQSELKRHLLPLVAFVEKANSWKFLSNVNNNLIWK